MSVQEMSGEPRKLPPSAYGHWGKRSIAFVLDELIVAPFGGIAYVMIAEGTPGWITFGVTIAAYGMAIGFYNRCILMGMTGQSWGKRAVGTRLVSAGTGEPLGVGATIVREMCHSADFILIVGALLPLFDGRRQSLGDKLAGSVVLNLSRKTAPTVPSPGSLVVQSAQFHT